MLKGQCQCRGLGFFVRDVLPGHPDFGKPVHCPTCTDFLKHCRLTPAEAKTTLADIKAPMVNLRKLGEAILADPWGFQTIWGYYGASKSLFLHAMVATFCRRGKHALYYHAADLQNAMYEDVRDPEKNNMALFKRVPILAIDEIDKWRLTDYATPQLQALIDHRYRMAVDRQQITLIASNRDPLEVEAKGQGWLPGDIQSRLRDGRWNRGDFPGIYHIEGEDMRPFLQRG